MGDITYIDKHRKGDKQAQDAGSVSIHCLLINIADEELLLPNTAVAEVVNYVEPEAVSNAPDWLLGLVQWRDRLIPLVSFETVSQSDTSYPGHGERIVICNSLNGNRKVPYVGFVSQGIPHLQIVKEDDLVNAADITSRQCVALTAKTAEGVVLIPNLDDLESRIEALQS